MEGTRLHLDGYGVDPDRHALHHFLCKAVLAVNTHCKHEQGNVSPYTWDVVLVVRYTGARFIWAYLWPAVIAIGEGPLGGRGSSHVLISTSTLSKNCTQEEITRHTIAQGEIEK